MIQRTKKSKSFLSAAALALLLAVATPSIALAYHDGHSSRGESTVTTQTDQSTSGSTDDRMTQTTTPGTGSDSPTDSTQHEDQSTQSREKARAEIKALRTEHNTKTTAEKREKVCESRKNGLKNKFANMSRNSVTYQARIDDIYAKSLAYQTTNSVTSDELTSLIAAADAAKAKATVSVTALQDAKTTIVDCKNTEVAANIAAFKTMASQARDDLKTYRQAVKDVLQSLIKSSKVKTQSNETKVEAAN